MFPRRPFCRISSRLATGHRLSRSGGYARSPRLIYHYSRFENLCREFCATDENFFNRQKEEKEKRPATSTGRLLSPTPRMQLTQHPSCFTDYLRGLSATFISTGVTSPTAGRTGYKRHSHHL